MKKRVPILMVIFALLSCAILAGCGDTGDKPSGGKPAQNKTQIANPWVDATTAEAAKVIGGTMYNLTTLDSAYKQYALIVTTNDAIKSGSDPTAWVRFKNDGEEDVSLQIFKGGQMKDNLMKGKKAQVNGADAYIAESSDGTSGITWEANGLLMSIGTSVTWDDAALIALAEGVKAAK